MYTKQHAKKKTQHGTRNKTTTKKEKPCGLVGAEPPADYLDADLASLGISDVAMFNDGDEVPTGAFFFERRTHVATNRLNNKYIFRVNTETHRKS